MTSRTLIGLAAAAALFVSQGCERDLGPLDPAPFPSDGAIFLDEFGPNVQFAAFGGSKTDALDIERDQPFRGTAALKFAVPGPGDPTGGYAGGAFFSTIPRDLTGFDALTFWARASTTATLNTVGLGNDNSGTSMFVAEAGQLSLSTTWTKYAVPIPLASKLERERGLFFLADAPEHPVGYNLWFDDVQFERLGTIINPRPAIASETVNGEVGGDVSVQGTQVTFDTGGTEQTVSASPAYFTFASSDASVATVTPDGSVALVGPGTATITATLGATAASGAVTVNVVRPLSEAPPTPVHPASDVISLFSNAYENVTVDTWSAVWDQADVADVQVAGDDIKKYTNLVFAGIEFTSQPVNATSMSHLHVDLWTSDASAFRIKLVDFGADGAFGGGDDSEHEITLDESTMPPLATDRWNTLDIPLSAFANLAGQGHLAQMIISGSSPTVYLDNIYFYTTAPSEPTEPAPVPTVSADNVVSLYSNAYDDAAVDTWSAVWDQADVEDIQIAGDDTKKYTNLVFAGIEFTSQPVDASAMTHFHFDFWTPDATEIPAAFRVKLVDFGADGAFGGGDDSEHEITLSAESAPALATGQWVSYDIPMSDFPGLAARGHLAQLIISGDPGTVFLDNIYLRN